VKAAPYSHHRVPDSSKAFAYLAKRNLAFMLPGFRFLFAAIVLSMSILVFGFGAAALLRTAHEEFASTPSWQPAPETRFAQSPQASQPVLALLRVDDAPQGTPKDAPKDAPKDTSKDMSKADQPASNTAPANAPADQAATGAAEPQAEPEKIAALQPANSSPPEVAKETTKETTKTEARMPDVPAAENQPPAEAAADAPAATGTTKIAATEQTLTPTNQTAPAEAAPATPEQASAPNPADANSISTRIATLGGPPVTIEQPQAKPESAKPSSAKSDGSAVKKRQHARRELRRRRISARARLVQQTTQPLDPFGQPTIATTTR
jgi:hypothetical protein